MIGTLVIAGSSVTKSSRQVSYLVGRLPRSRMVLAGWGTTWCRGRLVAPEWASDSSGFPDGHLTQLGMGI